MERVKARFRFRKSTSSSFGEEGEKTEVSAPQGDVVEGYELMEKLGAGAFATVRKCVRIKDGSVCAAKIFEKEKLNKSTGRLARQLSTGPSALDKVYEEVRIMRLLDGSHPNVLRLEGSHDAADKIYMFIEFVQHGPVMEWNEEHRFYSCRVTKASCGRERSGRYLYDVASGLSYLHSHCIAHRDLKPDNILLAENGRCKISDLGVAKHFEDLDAAGRYQLSKQAKHRRNAALQKSGTQVKCTEGTYAYWAPEMLSEKPFSAMSCDVWALGVCLFNFLTTKLPFDDDALDGIFDKIQRAQLPPTEDDQDLPSLVNHLLDKNTETRATLYDVLNDKWVVEVAAENMRRDRLKDFSMGRMSARLSQEQFRQSLQQKDFDEEELEKGLEGLTTTTTTVSEPSSS